MAKSPKKSRKIPGLPAPETVVGQFTLTRPEPPALKKRTGKTLKAPEAKVYTVLRTNQMDAYEPPMTAAAVARAAPPVGDNYGGTDRKAAKLTIADAQVEVFDDVKDLIATLPAEAAMKAHRPRITIGPNSGRVAEEQRNARVRAFIYAASHEADNDFHLIVGRNPTLSAMYMTMEVSGLPPADSTDHATLAQARADYKAFFQHLPNAVPGPSYDFYHPPIPVEIEGSLFFDMTHATGQPPGPQDLRDDMPVIWEVHPVTGIVFEP
jgi:hypothetical protein